MIPHAENRHAERAKVLLRHYVRLLMTRSGLQYTPDSSAELGEFVDAVILAAIDEHDRALRATSEEA